MAVSSSATQCLYRPPQGGQRHLVVLYATPPSTGNWQQHQEQLHRLGLSPGARIGIWVLLSITILFIVSGLWRMLCRSSRIYGPGPQISSEGTIELRQQPMVAADIELAQAQAPAPVLALTLECMYRSADGWAEQTCPVCMSELADGDMVRMLVVCKHSFHTACIQPWLRWHGTCPLCRAPATAKRSPNIGA